MYGHIATATGWTFAEIDQLTLWEVNHLFEYWQEYPPTHVLVGAYLMGDRRHKRSARKDFDELAQVVGSIGGAIKKKLPAGYASK